MTQIQWKVFYIFGMQLVVQPQAMLMQQLYNVAKIWQHEPPFQGTHWRRLKGVGAWAYPVNRLKLKHLVWTLIYGENNSNTSSDLCSHNFFIDRYLLGVNEKRCVHSSQNSFLEYRSHCSRHSWWMNLMLPVHIHGWNNGRSGDPSHRQTRQISKKIAIMLAIVKNKFVITRLFEMSY